MSCPCTAKRALVLVIWPSSWAIWSLKSQPASLDTAGKVNHATQMSLKSSQNLPLEIGQRASRSRSLGVPENHHLASIAMKPSVQSLPGTDDILKYVHQMLCSHDNLDPQQAPLRHFRIIRSGRLCGFFFQVNGPRAVKVYAVWASDENRILFFDSAGTRYAETRLSDSPEPAKLAA